MRYLHRLSKWVQGNATSADKVRVVWQTLAFILSNLLVIGGIFVALLLFLILIGGASQSGLSGEGETGVNLPAAVLQWKPKVTEEANKNDIPEAVDVLLTLIAVESGGNSIKTPDIMQCSESQGRPPNSIQNPNESIEVGVKYFADMYKGSGKKDLWNVVQAYNYGGGYLSFATGTYSFEEAKTFSSNKAGGERVMYTNPVALALGYDYRFNYGNMFYVALCKQYLVTTSGGNASKGYLIPVDNPNISSGFVARTNPVTGLAENHLGLDFAQPMGSAIKASKTGTVVISQSDGAPVSGYGECIILEHGDGSWTLYAHQSTRLAQVGSKVSQGQVIGKVGSTGQSTGPHLHFEIRLSLFGNHLDPAPLLGLSK